MQHEVCLCHPLPERNSHLICETAGCLTVVLQYYRGRGVPAVARIGRSTQYTGALVHFLLLRTVNKNRRQIERLLSRQQERCQRKRFVRRHLQTFIVDFHLYMQLTARKGKAPAGYLYLPHISLLTA